MCAGALRSVGGIGHRRIDLPLRGRFIVFSVPDQMTIGDLAHLAGVTKKTVRFYSNEGLLPSTTRSSAGYRLYTHDDLERLALIRALREAGLGLATIRSVLDREMTLREALTLRLAVVESHVSSLHHVAAAIRAALTAGPDEDDLRRVAMVTSQTNEDRRRLIDRFFADVYGGLSVDEDMIDSLREASYPKLADEPTRQQLDAWIELREILSDPKFSQWKRGIAEVWVATVHDISAERSASEEANAKARAAIARGVSPDSTEARQIAERFLVRSAAARGRDFDDAHRAELRAAYENFDPRETRFWQLVRIINQGHADVQLDESLWLQQAIRQLVAE